MKNATETPRWTRLGTMGWQMRRGAHIAKVGPSLILDESTMTNKPNGFYWRVETATRGNVRARGIVATEDAALTAAEDRLAQSFSRRI